MVTGPVYLSEAAKRSVVQVGFEPTPPKRLELESSALDHSATEPVLYCKFKNVVRHLQDSNLRGQSPADFESAALTSRPRCLSGGSRLGFCCWCSNCVVTVAGVVTVCSNCS